MESVRREEEPATAAMVPLTAPDAPRVPNYTLVQFVSAGGFGQVWLARESLTGVHRAVKLLDKRDAARAARELEGVRHYQRCAHNHPHLLQILTVGETETHYYCVMEAADSLRPVGDDGYEPVTLRSALDARGRWPARVALELLARLADAVSHLHQQGLRHCDLKPENVIYVGGEPKIADLGLIARPDQPAARAGTPAYMTPEGRADDGFALGLILYELCTGNRARDFPRLPAGLLRRREVELRAAIAIFNRAAHPDPVRRYPTVGTLRRDIASALGRRARRRSAQMLGVGLVLVAGAIWLAAAVSTGSLRLPTRPPRILHSLTWSPVRLEGTDVRHRPSPNRHVGDYPFVALADGRLPPDRRLVLPIQAPARHISLEVGFRTVRPWGTARISLASSEEGNSAVSLVLKGQADGDGILTRVERLDARGVDALSKTDDTIWNEPKPGVEYVVRLTVVGDEAVAAMWSLSQWGLDARVARVQGLPRDWQVRCLVVEGATGDPLASLELTSLRCSVLDRPVAKLADAPVPQEVLALGSSPPRPGWLPPIPASGAPGGDLLAPPLNPCSSSAWTSLGGWSWWEASCEPGQAAAIYATPCSTLQRKTNRDRQFGGLQVLRFDHGVYDDLEATLHVKLGDPQRVLSEPDHVPFVLDSSEGHIGLVFRWQDDALLAPSAAWPGGYVVMVALHPANRTPPRLSLHAFAGISLRNGELTFVEPEAAIASVTLPDFNALLSPRGLDLGVRCRGPEISISLDGETRLQARHERFARGRLALIASRLMATFEKLEVQPLAPAD
ncbi:MAG: serine/threonine protein kinase [Phycisphaerales bacterium]|nr:serine/threonine protein kinase [Phycisphaerales bacterium]